MKRIIITTPTLRAGGMERSVINFARMFSEKGIEVKIFMISSDEILYDVPKDIEVIYGKKRASDKHLLPISLFKLRRITKGFKPDFVLSFSGKLSSYVILALLGVNSNVIPFHRSNPYRTYGFFNNILNNFVYPRAKTLVVQTERAKSIFEKKYGFKNIIVVPNPIRELAIAENVRKENIVLSVSRLVDGKGLEQLIEIFHKINDPDWKLYIAGKGYLKEKLEKLISNLNLDNQVKLLGFQPNVDHYLSIASIFTFTSQSEGYPNALLEAMCTGLACISFDCPTGPAEMITDGENGFLVPLGDNEQYATKLSKLINDENLRVSFGNEAKKLRDKNFPSRIANNLIDSLTELEK